MHQSILHCSVFLLHCLNGHFAAMSKFTQEWLKWWPTTDDQKMVSLLWENNFVLTLQVPRVTNIHLFSNNFKTLPREKVTRTNKMIIKGKMFYQIFSNILKGNVWRSVWTICIWIVGLMGEQAWRSGESTRLPPMWPGFKSRRRSHMWVEFVVGSLPCS